MKRFLFSVIVLLSFVTGYSQVTIQMERDGGVYRIPCLVNGAKMKFIFDTGASSVCISMAMAEYLYDNNYLVKEDILGKGQAQVADGRIVDNIIINLRDVEIAGLHLKDVKATVSSSLTAPLLFGQSAIQKLGRVSIDGNLLTIHSATKKDLSDEELTRLSDLVDKYIDTECYDLAIECLLQIESAKSLSESGLFDLCRCYNYTANYKEVIQRGKQWLELYETLDFNNGDTTDSHLNNYQNSQIVNSYYNTKLIYYCLSTAYTQTEDYQNLLVVNQKLLNLEADPREIATLQADIGYCYSYLNNKFMAKRNLIKGIQSLCMLSKISINKVIESYNSINFNDEKIQSYLGLALFRYSSFLYKNKKDLPSRELLIMSAKCNFKPAIDMCNEDDINYHVKQSCYDLFTE